MNNCNLSCCRSTAGNSCRLVFRPVSSAHRWRVTRRLLPSAHLQQIQRMRAASSPARRQPTEIPPRHPFLGHGSVLCRCPMLLQRVTSPLSPPSTLRPPARSASWPAGHNCQQRVVCWTRITSLLFKHSYKSATDREDLGLLQHRAHSRPITMRVKTRGVCACARSAVFAPQCAIGSGYGKRR